MRFTMSWKTGSLMFMSVTGFSSGIPFGNRFFTSCNRHNTSFDASRMHTHPPCSWRLKLWSSYCFTTSKQKKKIQIRTLWLNSFNVWVYQTKQVAQFNITYFLSVKLWVTLCPHFIYETTERILTKFGLFVHYFMTAARLHNTKQKDDWERIRKEAVMA